MDKFQDKYRIQSTRLQKWDYGWDAPYFVTICTASREHFFGEIENSGMNLSGLGILADVLWHEIKNHAINVELDVYIVMPNHVHGILILNGNSKNGNAGGGNQCDETEMRGQQEQCDQRQRRDKACLVSTTPHHPTTPIPNTPASNIINPDIDTTPPTPNNNKTPGQKRFQNQGKNTLSSIVGSYKSAVSYHAHRLGFEFGWQSRFHDHIIRDEGEYQRIKNYIINNPANWDKDKFNRSGLLLV